MKMLTIKQMIAALVAVLSVCLFIGLLYSQPFADFANADESTAFYIYTTSAGAGHEFQESRPSREEMAPLLELLEAGSLRLTGRSRYIQWESEDALYRLFFCQSCIFQIRFRRSIIAFKGFAIFTELFFQFQKKSFLIGLFLIHFVDK